MSGAKLVAAWAAALAVAAVATVIVATSDHAEDKVLTIAFAVPAGLSFVASGLVALWRRPGNRIGYLLAATGYLWFLAGLSALDSPWGFTIGVLIGSAVVGAFVQLILAYPDGRLHSRVERAIVVGTWIIAFAWNGLVLLTHETVPGCDGCPENKLVVTDNEVAAAAAQTIGVVTACTLGVALIVVLVRRWRAASPALRRVLTPVLVTGGAATVLLVVSSSLQTVGDMAAVPFQIAFFAAWTAVPIAFLAGVLRSRLARVGVGRLLLELGDEAEPERLRDALGRALHDPTLQIGFWARDAGHYVDAEGRRFEPPAQESGRVATEVGASDRPIAVLVHDASLRDEPELVESVVAAARLGLERDRLQAEARFQYSLLETVVDTAPSLLAVVDTEGRIVNYNLAAWRAAGYDDPEAIRGMYFWDVFIDSSERDAIIERFVAEAPDHPAAEYENPFTNARGERLTIAWRSAPLRDETGIVTRIVAGGLDVTERRRQEEEIRASRARIVEAGDVARSRLERNLHDGAQQHLVSLSLALRLAETRLADDPAETRRLLVAAQDELARALEELRELARGIHPAVLTQRGLGAALDALVARAPVPVELRAPGERFPATVEAAAYYVVAEALTNVAKYASAQSVTVDVGRRDGEVVVEVRDDGVGGADAAAGTGLRGLADRIAALDGQLEVESRAGAGTTVRAAIPLPDGAVSRT